MSSLIVPPWYKPGAGAGGKRLQPLSVTQTAFVPEGTTNNSPFSWTGLSIGAVAGAGESRWIAAAFLGMEPRADTNEFTACDIGGISATRVVNNQSVASLNWYSQAIFIAKVPTGTTANVEVTFSSANLDYSLEVELFRIIAGADADLSSIHDSATDAVSNFDLSGTVNVPAGGIVIGTAMTTNDSTTSWTNLTEITNQDVYNGNDDYASGADEYASAQTGLTITYNTSGGNGVLQLATWGQDGAS